jgi:hypothetical protein
MRLFLIALLATLLCNVTIAQTDTAVYNNNTNTGEVPQKRHRLADQGTYRLGDRTFSGYEINSGVRVGTALLITGPVLTGVGVGSLAGGIYLITAGVRASNITTPGLFVGGVFLIITGGMETLAGIPLTIVGAVQYGVWKHRQRNAQLVAGIMPSGNLGFAMRF